MRKLIATINMSLDGAYDHTEMDADDEIHQHYTDLINSGDVIIYGRITYQLMEGHWPSVLKNPTGNKSDNDFAEAIDKIQKIVYSRTLKNVDWSNTLVKKEIIKEEIVVLKQQPGKPIFVGSPGLIIALMNLDLVDECQFMIHPAIVGKGPTLFKNINERKNLTLLKTKTFGSGAVVHYYGIKVS